MTEQTPPHSLQVKVEKTLLYVSQAFGIATGAGFVKRLRNPWIRATALATVAGTQALAERDRQIRTRKCFVEYQENISSPLAYLTGCDNEMFQRGPEEEVEREFVTLYNPNAILYKSLFAGATLGVLQPTYPLYDGKPIFSSAILDNLYGWCAGAPLEQAKHDASRFNFYMFFTSQIIEMKEGKEIHNRHGDFPFPFISKETDPLEEWRASSECWYGRRGKQPIFPFKPDIDA